tara:strand:- start:243 stop:449 length:207 start_codon:yes stop_codon:yes gene_type:complete
MKVQVFRRAKDVKGNTKAFKLRIDGVKYPRKHGAWFFVDSKEQAEQEAKKEMFKIMFSKYIMEGETMN